jgi:hypothetical protein
LTREKDYLLKKLAQEVADRADAKGWELHTPETSAPSHEGVDRVPRRLVPGLLTLCDLSPEDRPAYEEATGGQNPMWSRPLILALYRADGNRSVDEIERLVTLEVGESDVDLLPYFRFLEEQGLVEWI